MPDDPFTYWLVAAAAAAVALAFVLSRFAGRATRLPGTGVALAIALAVAGLAATMALTRPAGEDDAALEAGSRDRSVLVAHLDRRPRDGRAWVALARLDMDGDRFADAATHYAKAIEVSAKIARDPGVLCEYADALGMAQGGRLDGKPAESIERALALDPAHPQALEMAGSLAYERRDYRAAVRHWRALLEHFPQGTTARVELAAAIERAEKLAATTLPPAAAAQGG